MKSFKRLAVFLLIFALIIALFSFLGGKGGNSNTPEQTANRPSAETLEENDERGVAMDVDQEGNTNIYRRVFGGNSSSKDDKWTIFVYMCGSDLESDGGLATMDLKEMISGNQSDKFRYVVETGGATDWNANGISTNKMERFLIENGKITRVGQSNQASMGRSETLVDFLQWGLKEYSSDRMGLIFWNHGGGSISGICFDEIARNDSLTLREMDRALAAATKEMERKFDFIGFDACLMATIENANICATYADYLYASEESEPGYGWDYDTIGKFITKNSDADPEQIGQVVADSFYTACRQMRLGDRVTFSITDLSKIDELIAGFNKFAKNLYNDTADSANLGNVVRRIYNVPSFGGNNWSSGYTNMVDLGGIVQASGSNGAQQVMKLLDDAIVYMCNGSDYKNVTGLSTYYPLKIQNSAELTIFSDVAISPYYLSFVDRAAQTSVSHTSSCSSGVYSILDLFNLWNDIQSGTTSSTYTSTQQEAEEYFEYYDEHEETGESSLIDFTIAPTFDNEGYYGFVLTPEALENTLSVEGNVYYQFGDDLLFYGTTVDLYLDYENGIFTDNFDGYWFSLPDGQNLSVFIQSEGDGYDIYTSPVSVNGKDTNLIIKHNYAENYVEVLGCRDSVDSNGMADRITYTLKKGDIIVPLYHVYNSSNDQDVLYEGKEYKYSGDPKIVFDFLPDGDYYFGFTIYDIYWDYLDTDYVSFTIDGDNIYYSNN